MNNTIRRTHRAYKRLALAKSVPAGDTMGLGRIAAALSMIAEG